MSSLRLLVLSAGLMLVSTPLWADDLDEILARDQLAAQKLINDVNYALKESAGLEKSSPGQASILLQATLSDVRDSTVLPAEQRNLLAARLQARLRDINEIVRVQKLAAEEKAVRDAEGAIRKAREEGLTRGPGPSDTAKRYLNNTADQIAAVERLRKASSGGSLSALDSVQASATPIAGDVEFPKYWERIVNSKHRGSGQKLHPKEVALLKALNSTLSIDFDNTALRDVINYLQEKSGQAIIVPKSSLEDAGIEYDDPVSFKISGVTVRTVLKKILGDRNLTYVIQEGTIQVVTRERAREMMVVRSYPIQDLVGLTDLRLHPLVNRVQMLNNVQGLITTLQSGVDPSLWDINGGTGTITFHEPTMSIIVRAPAEMHYMLGSGSMFR